MALSNGVSSTLLYLISCVINDQKPDLDTIQSVELEELYALSKEHFVTAICYHALSSAYSGQLPQTEIFAKWKQDKDLILRKMILFDMEYERVAAFLEENDVWHVRLKGAEIQKFYPSPEMREMSDVDILFDDSKHEIVERFFLENGYEPLSSSPCHYEFLKKPVYNFEMHKILFSSWKNRRFYEYYSGIKEKLVPKEGTTCTYLFRPEDMYIFYMAHEFKHYSVSGIGVRSLLDCFLMKTKAPADFDWGYAAQEMEKLEIKDFHDSISALAFAVFSDPDRIDTDSLSPAAMKELSSLISSGVYGNTRSRVKKQLSNISNGRNMSSASVKTRYIFRRLFPSKSFFREYYPELNAKKCPLVFMWIYRIGKGLRKKRGQIKQEIKLLNEEHAE